MSQVVDTDVWVPLDREEYAGAPESVRPRWTGRRDLWVVAGVALLVAVLLWFLAGIHRLPTWEGWAVFAEFRHGKSGWWLTPPTGAWAGNSVRPLEALPHQIAYLLSSQTFVGFNLVSMLACVARCVAGYLLLRELLDGHRMAAAVGALLFALSPAADGSMLDRTIHAQWSAALAIGGIAALLMAIRADRTALALLSAVLVSASVLMYEIALPVVVLMAVYALVAAGPRRRSAIRSVAIYGASVLITVGYLLWLRRHAGATYQDGIATLQRPLTDHEGIRAIVDALRWDFGGSVVDTLRNVLPMPRPALTAAGWAVTIGIAAVGVVLAVVLARTVPARPGGGRLELLRPVALGVVWVGVALSILLPFIPYRYETLRAHSVAQFGAVLVFAALLKALVGRFRAVALLVAGVALIATSAVAVENALMWKKFSDFQSQFLAALIEQTSSPDVHTVVIEDHSDRLGHIYNGGPWGKYLAVGRDVLTGGPPLDIIVCTSGTNRLGPALMGQCHFTDEGLTVDPSTTIPGQPDVPHVFKNGDYLHLDFYGGDQPQLRPHAGSPEHPLSPLPARVAAALPCLVGQPCATDAVTADLPSAPVFEQFDRPYSYEDLPIPGAPVEDLGYIQVDGAVSYRWTTSENAAIYADLGPGRYVVRVRVLRSAVPGGTDAARLSLNGTALPTTATPDGSGATVLEAVGTVGADSPRADRVGILGPINHVAGDPGQWLGLAVDWVSVQKAQG